MIQVEFIVIAEHMILILHSVILILVQTRTLPEWYHLEI